jgi:hypothetical protein
VLSLSKVYRGHVTFIVVAHRVVIAVEGFTTAQVLGAKLLLATAAIHTRNPLANLLSISLGRLLATSPTMAKASGTASMKVMLR